MGGNTAKYEISVDSTWCEFKVLELVYTVSLGRVGYNYTAKLRKADVLCNRTSLGFSRRLSFDVACGLMLSSCNTLHFLLIAMINTCSLQLFERSSFLRYQR